MDYVGNQRSPLWDDMEAMEDENAKIGQDLPSLEAEIERLKVSLIESQRKTRMMELYKQADPEASNALSTKAMVAKLSGFAKFDVDMKMSCEHMVQLVNNLATAESGSFSEEKFEEIMDAMTKAFVEGNPPYAGDLENETYKAIIQAIRDLNTSELNK
mmetsp:Transcript_32308/g.42784  ORF Transcript_32308/g.42784 Transcript_32308/m.42784 type:complete len:158 (-) Transcript_32308:120-593(-)|eukprot:Macronucleus_6158.p1 GENE.Macronucleus_6158~~Macronucleus_6158.p1  ORF type:complete len:158 (+),score=56.88 Macronucleus_6158:1-474(+)